MCIKYTVRLIQNKFLLCFGFSAKYSWLKKSILICNVMLTVFSNSIHGLVCMKIWTSSYFSKVIIRFGHLWHTILNPCCKKQASGQSCDPVNSIVAGKGAEQGNIANLLEKKKKNPAYFSLLQEIQYFLKRWPVVLNASLNMAYDSPVCPFLPIISCYLSTVPTEQASKGEKQGKSSIMVFLELNSSRPVRFKIRIPVGLLLSGKWCLAPTVWI